LRKMSKVVIRKHIEEKEIEDKMTYRELALKTGMKVSRLKRYGRMFLDEDVYCGCQSGRARNLSDHEAWILYVIPILYNTGCRNIKQLLKELPESGIWKINTFYYIVTLFIDIDRLKEDFNDLSA